MEDLLPQHVEACKHPVERVSAIGGLNGSPLSVRLRENAFTIPSLPAQII
jgi:hypothetical protein